MVSMALVKRYPVAVFFGASVSIGWIVTIAAARLPGASALLPLVAILVVLAHAMYDTASVGVAPFASTGVPLVAFALSAAVTWVVAIGMLVVLGRTQMLAPTSEATARPVGG